MIPSPPPPLKLCDHAATDARRVVRGGPPRLGWFSLPTFFVRQANKASRSCSKNGALLVVGSVYVSLFLYLEHLVYFQVGWRERRRRTAIGCVQGICRECCDAWGILFAVQSRSLFLSSMVLWHIKKDSLKIATNCLKGFPSLHLACYTQEYVCKRPGSVRQGIHHSSRRGIRLS